MAMFPLPASRVKQHLQRFLPEDSVDQSLRKLGTTFRKRKLSPGRSVHLLLLQLLHKTALSGLRHFTDSTATASAICQARARLPLRLMYVLVEQLAAVLLAHFKVKADALFHGLEVVLLDATSFHTQDTSPLAKRYGKHRNQRKTVSGYPTPKLLCLINHATGLITRAMTLPAHRQEHMCVKRMIAHLQPGQVVVAGRGLVSFMFLCELTQAAVQACLRLPLLHMARAQGSRRILKVLGKGDLLVHWDKSPARSKAYSRRAYAALPASLVLRQITYAVTRPGFRPKTITLITTLLDPVEYPACDLAELYLQRWQIEVYFRDLKTSQGMNRMRGKSLASMRKELLGHVLLYNLVRAVMLEAAARQNVPAERISFLDALRRLRHAAEGSDAATLLINPVRNRPSEPRRIKGRQYRFKSLTLPREEYRKQLLRNAA